MLMLFWIIVAVIAACSLLVLGLCIHAARPMRSPRPDDQEWTSEVGFWGQQ